MYILVASVLFLSCAQNITAKNIVEYKIERDKLIEEESQLQLGGNLKLNDDEQLANEIIMRYKHKEVEDSIQNPKYLNFSKHFFTYRKDIQRSKVYQIIKMMPKGAALHVHSSLMLSADRLLALTYEDHLYTCFTKKRLKFHFSRTVPKELCPRRWQLLSKLRKHTNNIHIFDKNLKRHFTMYTKHEKDLKHDTNYSWRRFNKVIQTRADLIAYRPVREKVFHEGLKKFYDDNIMYIEVRSGLSKLYELNGTVHDLTYIPHLYNRVVNKFKKTHPDFVGVKLIVTKSRDNIFTVYDALKTAREVQKELPDMFAGFDLVGQEDLGKPLLDFLPILQNASDEINFYFHGGETNWYGTSTDENLFDAVLLGTKRLGHGYALLKHPQLMAAIRAKDIAIEVNVISNIVLSLVTDVRNHPLAAYLAYGMPVVLSSDDPGAWGADPLSHDFYIAFVGIASKRADLRLLKQLVINSVKYSSLEYPAKSDAFRQLFRKWDVFISNVIRIFK